MSLIALPPKAAAKLATIIAHAADIEAVARAATIRAAELDHRMAFAAPPPDERNRAPTAMSAEAVQLKAQIEEQRSRAAVHHAKSAAMKQLLTNIENFRRDFKPGFRLVDAKPVELPKLAENSFQHAVGEIRYKIGERAKDLRHLASVKPTKSERDAMTEAYVYGLVRKARPTIRTTHTKASVEFGVGNALMSKADVAAAMLAWLSPEQFLARLIEVQDAEATGHVMSAEELAKETAAIRAKVALLERREEAIIVLASKHDMEITRRPTASPLSVLEVEMVRIEATAAA